MACFVVSDGRFDCKGRLKQYRGKSDTVPVVEHQAEADAVLFVVVVNQAFAVAMETADNAFEFAFEWEGVSSFNGTASASRVVTQDGINILFVIEAVLDFQVAVAHVFVDVRIVVVISFLVEGAHPDSRNDGQLAPFHAGHGINAVP